MGRRCRNDVTSSHTYFRIPRHNPETQFLKLASAIHFLIKQYYFFLLSGAVDPKIANDEGLKIVENDFYTTTKGNVLFCLKHPLL